MFDLLSEEYVKTFPDHLQDPIRELISLGHKVTLQSEKDVAYHLIGKWLREGKTEQEIHESFMDVGYDWTIGRSRQLIRRYYDGDKV